LLHTTRVVFLRLDQFAWGGVRESWLVYNSSGVMVPWTEKQLQSVGREVDLSPNLPPTSRTHRSWGNLGQNQRLWESGKKREVLPDRLLGGGGKGSTPGIRWQGKNAKLPAIRRRSSERRDEDRSIVE